MKYGLLCANIGSYSEPRFVADLAEEAENAGWDGLFIWAGQSTMDTGAGGVNDNLVYGNDFSFAPANAMEATFSRNTLVNNRCDDSDYGLWAGYSYDTVILGNEFVRDRFGVAIEHGQDNRIELNRFEHDSTGVSIWANRVDKDAEVRPGATLRVYADLLPASDGTAPFAIHTFNGITGGDTIRPRQIAIANDHFVFNHRDADDKQTGIGREFAERHGIGKPHYATPGDGIFHFYFPEQKLVLPGALIPGADSHSRAYGAYGALGYGVGSTTLGFGWATGYVYFTVAKQRRVVFTGKLQPWVSGKDVVLALLARWGQKQAQGMSVEFVDAAKQLPMSYRNTIANMMAEGEALNGIFAPDDLTYAWYSEKGATEFPYPRFAPGEHARYEIDETLDLSEVVPLIAKPFSPANAFAATEVARERITFDKAFIGSCTNGGYSDLLEAALVIRAARAKGTTRSAKEFVIFPGSGAVKRDIEKTDPRLDGESIADVFRAAGAEIRESWCGPCFGQGPDALRKGESAITSFNRNWTNRMGVGGLGYLASPAVVAASALLGYMGPPSELGIEWRAERFV